MSYRLYYINHYINDFFFFFVGEDPDNPVEVDDEEGEDPELMEILDEVHDEEFEENEEEEWEEEMCDYEPEEEQGEGDVEVLEDNENEQDKTDEEQLDEQDNEAGENHMNGEHHEEHVPEGSETGKNNVNGKQKVSEKEPVEKAKSQKEITCEDDDDVQIIEKKDAPSNESAWVDNDSSVKYRLELHCLPRNFNVQVSLITGELFF